MIHQFFLDDNIDGNVDENVDDNADDNEDSGKKTHLSLSVNALICRMADIGHLD